MSFVIDNFDDLNKWMETISGSGVVSERTSDLFKAIVNAADDTAGLVTVNLHDLSSCDIRAFVDRPVVMTALIIRETKEGEPYYRPDGTGLYAIIRDEGYGVQVFDGLGWKYIGADPVSPDEPAELRIVISEGVASFYYNGAFIYSEPVPHWCHPSSMYVSLVAFATRGARTTVGTNTFASTGYMPPLSVTLTPSTPQEIIIGDSLVFTANVSGGISPYVIDWYVNDVKVASGSEMTLTPAEIGTYNVYAIATDAEGTTATSPSTQVTVSPLPSLSVSVHPTSAFLYPGETETFTATPSGGTAPYTLEWINAATDAVIGAGETFEFSSTVTGAYEIFARVTDNVGDTASSLLIAIDVTESLPPPTKETQSEIQGVFLHEAILSYPHDWNVIAETLAAYKIGVVCANLMGTGQIRPHDEWINAINAFHSRGIKFNVVMGVLGQTGGDPALKMINSVGETLAWYCPIKARQLIKETVETVASTYDIDGFTFDYTRYPSDDVCYCPECKATFEAWLGESITDWPGDFAPGGSRHLEFMEWRIIPVTEIVRDVRNWMLAIKPNLRFRLAAFTLWGGTCALGYWRYYLGQDTADWIMKGYIDWVSPMMYTTDLNTIQQELQCNLEHWIGGKEGKIPLTCSLTTGITEPVDPNNFKQQIGLVRSLGADGFVIWRYGGPGCGLTPDITEYLALLDIPDVFSLENIAVSPSETEAVISWTTNLPATSKIEYSTSPLFKATKKPYPVIPGFSYWDIAHVPGIIVENHTPVTDHNVTLTGLLLGRRYYYRVQSEGSGGIATSKVYTFITGGAPETVTISGVVVDAETSQPIQGALVKTDSYETTSGVDGSFTLTDLPPNIYTLTIMKAGYETFEILDVDATTDVTFTDPITLTPKPTPEIPSWLALSLFGLAAIIVVRG